MPEVSVIEVDEETTDNVSSFAVFLLQETASGNTGLLSTFPNEVVIVSFRTLFFFLLKALNKNK